MTETSLFSHLLLNTMSSLLDGSMAYNKEYLQLRSNNPLSYVT